MRTTQFGFVIGLAAALAIVIPATAAVGQDEAVPAGEAMQEQEQSQQGQQIRLPTVLEPQGALPVVRRYDQRSIFMVQLFMGSCVQRGQNLDRLTAWAAEFGAPALEEERLAALESEEGSIGFQLGGDLGNYAITMNPSGYCRVWGQGMSGTDTFKMFDTVVRQAAARNENATVALRQDEEISTRFGPAQNVVYEVKTSTSDISVVYGALTIDEANSPYNARLTKVLVRNAPEDGAEGENATN